MSDSDRKHSYRDILFQQFELKKERNIRYSLRAFARDLQVPVSRLSEVFNGKACPSIPLGHHLATKLNLPDFEKDLFITSIQVQKEKIGFRKQIAEKRLEVLENQHLENQKSNPVISSKSSTSLASIEEVKVAKFFESPFQVKAQDLAQIELRIKQFQEELSKEFGLAEESSAEIVQLNLRMDRIFGSKK